jgi:hypothetical protein
VAGAAALGLDAGTAASTLNLQGMDRPIAGAEPDNSIFNPVNLLTDVVTGGAAIGVKASLEALLQCGARSGTKAAAAKAESRIWPKTAEEMDDLLGFPGKRIPDGPMTPGRNKVTFPVTPSPATGTDRGDADGKHVQFRR